MSRELSVRELLVGVLEVMLSARDSGGLTGDGIIDRLKSETGIELDEEAAWKQLVPMVQNLEKQGYIANGKTGWVLTDEGADYASKTGFSEEELARLMESTALEGPGIPDMHYPSFEPDSDSNEP